MNRTLNPIAHNIKYFRKNLSWSQEELAQKLSLKRSKIAAYESKNVEPKIQVLLELAKVFDVRVEQFISEKITAQHEIKPFKTDQQGFSKRFHNPDNQTLGQFIERSLKVKKMLEGFKAFYALKRANYSDHHHGQRLLVDIENFIELIEQLLNYNERIIEMFNSSSSQKLI